MNIPDFCYTLNNMTINPKTGVGEIIKVRALESGYYKTSMMGTQEAVDRLNTEIGVTKAQEKAMSTCSMFNWEMYPNCLSRYIEIYKEDDNDK